MIKILNCISSVILFFISVYKYLQECLSKNSVKQIYKDSTDFINFIKIYKEFNDINKAEILSEYLFYPFIFIETNNDIIILSHEIDKVISKVRIKNNSLDDIILDSVFVEENNKIDIIIKVSKLNYILVFKDNSKYNLILSDTTTAVIIEKQTTDL